MFGTGLMSYLLIRPVKNKKNSFSANDFPKQYLFPILNGITCSSGSNVPFDDIKRSGLNSVGFSKYFESNIMFIKLGIITAPFGITYSPATTSALETWFNAL